MACEKNGKAYAGVDRANFLTNASKSSGLALCSGTALAMPTMETDIFRNRRRRHLTGSAVMLYQCGSSWTGHNAVNGIRTHDTIANAQYA
jgi:hypothetical protein